MSYKPELGSIPFLLAYFEHIKGVWLPIKKIPIENGEYNNELDDDKKEEEDFDEISEDHYRRNKIRKEGKGSFYQYDSEFECFRAVLQIPAYNSGVPGEVLKVPFKIGNSGLKFCL